MAYIGLDDLVPEEALQETLLNVLANKDLRKQYSLYISASTRIKSSSGAETSCTVVGRLKG